jgi:hypothetical protein
VINRAILASIGPSKSRLIATDGAMRIPDIVISRIAPS